MSQTQDLRGAIEGLYAALDAWIEGIQSEGARDLDEGDTESALAAIERVRALAPLRAELDDVTQRLLAMTEQQEPPPEPDDPDDSAMGQSAYCLPILRALVELGGKVSSAQVLRRVQDALSCSMTPADREITPGSGNPRWRSRCYGAAAHLRRKGYLARDSRHGLWEITEAGRAYWDEHG